MYVDSLLLVVEGHGITTNRQSLLGIATTSLNVAPITADNLYWATVAFSG